MDEITDAELAGIARGIGALAARIPDGPAARLGRSDATGTPGRGAEGAWALVPAHPIVNGLRALGRDADRLLGALELAVRDLDGPDLSARLGPAPQGPRFMLVTPEQDGEAMLATSSLLRMYPRLGDLALAWSERLAAHPSAVLPAAPDGADEQTIAARHGAGYAALAVSVAGALLRGVTTPPLFSREAAVVGVGLGVATILLRTAPKPSGYRAALLARVRAEYLFPQNGRGSAHVAGHRFALVENGRSPVEDGRSPVDGDFTATGLVAAVPGGVVIRTGIAAGPVQVECSVFASAPEAVPEGWDEVAEVSWRAAEGGATVTGAGAPAGDNIGVSAPPWPGDYRLRVHANGRDPEEAYAESYLLEVWAAPPSPPVVLRRTDRLGHRLRGEPEPPVPPERAYRWIRSSRLRMAATVTVVVGLAPEAVLAAFGDDREGVEVVGIPGAVLVVEENHYRGSHEEVLAALSANGPAASMFWNVNMLTRLSFAEDGRVLAAFEPGLDADVPEEVAGVLEGISFADGGGVVEKGLLAVERFTGHAVMPDDVDRDEDDDEPVTPPRLGRRLGTIRFM
ncbi:DUF6461 domain-containing protein [Catenuloplanes japonicus]|uniref:DUF6461 domain-containing protein n=1 Tax=Catenuloplanes japonicus TaxID=33876 RepID=UPI0006920E31|nr:DUF6461 domain-containing protein [Catenuloplanes japonicus]